MKSEMSFFEKTFWKSSFFSKIQHVIRNIQSFDCHVFWKQKWPIVSLKWLFFMVFYVSFNLWSRVYLFMVYNEVTFCEFQGKRKAQVKTWGFIKKDCFLFLALILSACIITSSLIHEATTLMEKPFKFWERHLSVQIAYLIKKGF